MRVLCIDMSNIVSKVVIPLIEGEIYNTCGERLDPNGLPCWRIVEQMYDVFGAPAWYSKFRFVPLQDDVADIEERALEIFKEKI